MHTYGVGHEAEHADGRVEHDETRDLDHDVGRAVEEVEHLLALVADDAEAEAEEQGEEDDLEHVALGEGLNGVDRDDVQEHVDERGRGDILGLEAFRGNGQPAAGLEDVGEHEADDHGDGRGNEVIGQRLACYAPELAYVADAGRTRDEGGQHERHHDHAHQIDEQLAYGLVP